MTRTIQSSIEEAKKIDGWMSDPELRWLATNARGKDVIIEVGSHKGRSTRALADNTDGVVYAIDPWSGPYHKDDGNPLFYSGDEILAQFIKNTLSCGNIIICRGTFDSFLKDLPQADFIFLDGDHRYDFVSKDIWNAKYLLKKGGILSGHDYIHKDWPGVKKAVDELEGEINLINSIWWKIHE